MSPCDQRLCVHVKLPIPSIVGATLTLEVPFGPPYLGEAYS